MPCFDKIYLSQFRLYIETETLTQCFACCNFLKTIIIQSAKGKEAFLYSSHVKDPYWFAKDEQDKFI